MESLAPRLARVRVVIVEPRYDGNLGQICRAMINFGLTRLWLAGGQADPRSQEARWYARDEGMPVLDAAVKVDTFDQAIHGCSLVVGTSRRVGKGRGPAEPPAEVLAELAPWRRDGETALVFGREAHGLYNDELERCGRFIAIPSDPASPSLNVSHAVAVVGYALALAARAELGDAPKAREVEPAPAEAIEAMFLHARQAWLRIGYLKQQNPDAVLRRFRRIFGRTELDAGEVAMIRGLFHQIEWIAGLAGVPEEGPDALPPGFFSKHPPAGRTAQAAAATGDAGDAPSPGEGAGSPAGDSR